MTYDEALGYIKTLPKPNTVSCKKYPGAYQKYQQEEGVTSIVPDVIYKIFNFNRIKINSFLFSVGFSM